MLHYNGMIIVFYFSVGVDSCYNDTYWEISSPPASQFSLAWENWDVDDENAGFKKKKLCKTENIMSTFLFV